MLTLTPPDIMDPYDITLSLFWSQTDLFFLKLVLVNNPVTYNFTVFFQQKCFIYHCHYLYFTRIDRESPTLKGYTTDPFMNTPVRVDPLL